MGSEKNKKYIIENEVEELPNLAEKIEKLGESWDLSQAITMNVNLVMEEALSNIIFYAFNDKNKHEIEIYVSIKKNKLTITFKDDGVPFNPLSQQKPDINLSAEERPVGGLGIFLMSQIMDEMHYNRQKNKNILTLAKDI